MDVDGQREHNIERSEQEAQAGPVRSSPGAMPIGEAIEDFHHREDLSLGIPAPRSGTGRHNPGASRWAGEVVEYLPEQAAAGVMVEGAADETRAGFRVVSG